MPRPLTSEEKEAQTSYAPWYLHPSDSSAQKGTLASLKKKKKTKKKKKKSRYEDPLGALIFENQTAWPNFVDQL